MPVFTLSKRLSFPPAHMAIREGLLAVGGDLCVDRLVLAYRKGIFPWYSPGAPILWWSPDPRLVLFPNELKISRSLKKLIHQHRFRITLDVNFEAVIRACAETPRAYGSGTWITPEMKAAYCALHRHGYAHSVEAWQDGTLVGGLYGVVMGRVFFGESMFTRVSNASKVAFVMLVEHLRKLDFALVDCQVKTDHLMRFGAREISRKRFLEILSTAIDDNTGAADSVTPPVFSLFFDSPSHAFTDRRKGNPAGGRPDD
ncbi:leucyl/phenylalanyl-tRNA--protein transferase [Desulfosarcina sp. OttesenSCG-928-A07]|nr:leucyl/phenylalanyl-tRNA--protein transferase [Desulfosarcina sp. OttesenSCG-928-A07]